MPNFFNLFGKAEQNAARIAAKKLLQEGPEALTAAERALLSRSAEKVEQAAAGKIDEVLPSNFSSSGLEQQAGLSNKRALRDQLVEKEFQTLKQKGQQEIPLEPLPRNITGAPVSSDELTGTLSQTDAVPPPLPRMTPPPPPKVNFAELADTTIDVLPPPTASQSFLQKIMANKKKLAALGIGGATLYGMSEDEPQNPAAPQIASEVAPASEPIEEIPVLPQENAESSPIKQSALTKLETALQQPSQAFAARKPEIQDYDVGEGGIAAMEGLKQAQAAEEADIMASQLGNLGDIVGGAISGQGEQFKDYFDNQQKLAGRHVSRFKDMLTTQEQDPDSPMSKMFNDYAKQMGFNLKGRMSYAQGKELMPKLAAQFEKEQDRAFKGEENNLNRLVQLARIEEMKQTKADAKESKGEEQSNRFIERRADKLATHAKAFGELRQAKAMIDSAMKDPSGVKDVSALYSIIKALDPASVVREGEVALAGRAKGLWGNLSTQLSQITANPRLLNEKVIKDMASAIDDLYGIAEREYGLRRDVTFKQAKARGINEERFGELDPYFDSKGQVPEQKQETSAPKVKVKNNEDGRVKLLDADKAAQVLKNPKYSKVE